MKAEIHRRDFLKIVGAGAASIALPGTVLTAASGAGRKKSPNIIFIMADDRVDCRH